MDRMNKIHKIVGLALQNCAGIGIYSGLVIGFLIHYFAYTKFVLISHVNIFIAAIFILGFSSMPAAKIFYTTDKFDEYIKGRVSGPKSWRLEPLEPLFYPTMISNISISRKIAGYAYALSQILIINFMVTLLSAIIFDKFGK